MLEIKLYLNHEEIKDCYKNGADAEVATVTDFDGKTYCFETESQNEDGLHYGILYCYEQQSGETVDKYSTFGLFKDLTECQSDREIINEILDYLEI